MNESSDRPGLGRLGLDRAARCALATLLIFPFLLAQAAGAQQRRTTAPPPPERLAATLETLVSRLLREGDVPGLSLAVVRGGEVSWQGSLGVTEAGSAAAVTKDTVFEAASLSKPVFAYAVLKLADAGRLDLDAPLAKLLPGDFVDDPRQGLITARRVLSHTTGLPNWRPRGEPLKVHFIPGERFSYSGEGFVYLQKAVEHMTGQTLDALMKSLVFDPLHMTSSSFVWQERYAGLKATGHDAGGSPLRLGRPTEALSAATLHTTAPDYARFLNAVLAGTGLKESTAAEMRRAQIHVDEGCENCIDQKPTGRLSRELAWGLGWGLEETEQGLALWHWGDNGGSGFHCFVIGYPKTGLGVVVFTNGAGGHGIIPDIVTAAIGGRHPAFAWLGYERYDSPARVFFKDVLTRGQAAIDAYRERSKSTNALTEPQVNRVGYWLLGKKKTKESVAVFELNTRDFPTSWNAFDSLGEALAADGQKERAIASYEKSLALNPESPSGLESLRKLKTAPTP